MAFVIGFEKIAVMDLPRDALVQATTPMQTAVPGASLDKSTAQAKGRATRTFNVRNEDREFGSTFHRKVRNARDPGI